MGAVLGVLLAILKWIGIILLCIPIRIRARGTAGKDVDKIRVEGDVTYLLKAVHARIFFADKSLAWQLAVFGKRIAGSEGPSGKKSGETADSAGEAGAGITGDESPGNADTAGTAETSVPADGGVSGGEPPTGSAAPVTPDEPPTVEIFYKKKNPYRPGWVDELEQMQASDRAREEAEAFGEVEKIRVTGQAEKSEPKPEEGLSGEGFTEETSETKQTGGAENAAAGGSEGRKEPEGGKEPGGETSGKETGTAADEKTNSGGEPQAEEPGDGIPDWAKDVMTPIGPGKIEELEEKIGGILAKVDYYKMLLDAYPERPEIIRAVKRLLRRLLRQFRFRDSHLSLRYGFEDPSLAGFLTAGAAIASHIIPSREFQIDFLPQFEEELVIEGDFDIGLRIILQAFIHYFLCFLLYPPTVRLIIFVIRELKKGKKEKETNGKEKKKNKSRPKKAGHKKSEEAKEPNHESERRTE